MAGGFQCYTRIADRNHFTKACWLLDLSEFCAIANLHHVKRFSRGQHGAVT